MLNPELQALIPELVSQLKIHPRLILEAPPGSGKTTQVPLALLKAPAFANSKILMLEPRRLAARSAAHYMSHLIGESVGQQIGYRVRLDSCIGPNTRLEIVTEGVLTRLLQADQALADYGVVIFDEFHERSLASDLGLALAHQAQSLLRDDLKLLIMSATLNSERLAQHFDAPVLQTQGRSYPVEISYAAPPANSYGLRHIEQSILQALAQHTGSLLVFLPGQSEIRRLATALASRLPANVSLSPLYGNLSHQEQDQAIQPAPEGQRKVVLATNLAETSLTIEGIRLVIDSGLERAPRFDAVSGMTELVTRQISQASATQRAGRAGRLEAGNCLRLWHASDSARMLAETPPEILEADLAGLALELALWGSQPDELSWLDPPPPQAWLQAQALLLSLNAIDAQSRITEHGRQLARLPLHPRLAHMVIQGQAAGHTTLAIAVAAILNERDPLAGQTRESDLTLRIQALSGQRNAPGNRVSQLKKSMQQIAERLKSPLKLQTLSQGRELDQLGWVLALAYPERLAQRRPGGPARFLLANGRGAVLADSDALANAEFLAIAHLDGNPRESKIFLAASLSREQLDHLTASQQIESTLVSFDPQQGRVKALWQKSYQSLILEQKPIQNPGPELIVQALIQGLQAQPEQWPWSTELSQWIARADLIAQHDPKWPRMDLESLSDQLEEWLAPFLTGISKLSAIKAQHLQQGLEYRLGYQRVSELNTLAPTHLEVPSGSRIRLDYSQGPEPILAARIQELFGLLQTPKIRNQELPVLIHLLSPARRPVQVTRDLHSFWSETYPQVKKELKGRYPRHFWPDDPFEAQAIQGIRPRKS